jgi:hypothetical protein
MNKSRFFITAGALVLGVVGIFATKPSKKFTDFAVKFNGVSGLTGITANTSAFTINAGSLKTAILRTSGLSIGYAKTLVTSGGSDRVYAR